jgi:nicotinamide mononucleotide adenylyltransferase
MIASTGAISQEILDVGCVHGRFQPFHNEHLEYVSRAYQMCRLLYIGITHSLPGSNRIVESAPHRHKSDANPLTYNERMEMIIETLLDIGYDISRIRVVPFPIEEPHLICNYVPARAVHFMSPCDEWQIEKYRNLSISGFHVQWVLGTRKGVDASTVRSLLRKESSICRLVPPAVTKYLALLRAEPGRSMLSARSLFSPKTER